MVIQDAADATNTKPLSLEAFATACARIKLPSKSLIAVSGGRDSIALLHLMVQLQAKIGCEVIAATIDHALRSESRKEAEQVAHWCAKLGVPHKIITWHHDGVTSGLQAKARAARYGLLARYAASERCGAILTGHQANDQAETMAMRLERQPNDARGMRARIWVADGAGQEIALLRPMLEFDRASLTAMLAAHGQSFLDDPSNEQTSFERVRVRARLATLSGAQKKLLANAERGALKRASLDAEGADLFQAIEGIFLPAGVASLDFDGLMRADRALAAHVFAKLLRALSAADYAPSPLRALDAMKQLFSRGSTTLGGAHAVRRQGRIWIGREAAAVFGRQGGAVPNMRLPIEAGAPLLWDRRFICMPPPTLVAQKPLTIAPLGRNQVAHILAQQGDRGEIGRLPPVFRATLPAIWSGDRLVATLGWGARMVFDHQPPPGQNHTKPTKQWGFEANSVAALDEWRALSLICERFSNLVIRY